MMALSMNDQQQLITKDELLKEYRKLSQRLGKRVDMLVAFIEDECIGHDDILDQKIINLMREYRGNK